MKQPILFALFLLIVTGCKSDMEPSISLDHKVKNYIDSFGVYIRMNDRQKTHKILGKDHAKILDYMKENGMNKDNYFILDGELALSKDLNYIMIPLRHYESLKKEMEKGRDMKSAIEQQKVSELGNLSGKDGYLILDIKKNKIDRFQLWE